MEQLLVEVKKDGENWWTHCLTYASALDYPVHTYITSGGKDSQAVRRGINVNSIMFYDNEVEMEGELLDWLDVLEAETDLRSNAQDVLH